jgi:hypothetical protein
MSFTCPVNVSSFRNKPKIFSTKCLSNSSKPGSMSSCVEQEGASSTLEGPAEFKGTGLWATESKGTGYRLAWFKGTGFGLTEIKGTGLELTDSK